MVEMVIVKTKEVFSAQPETPRSLEKVKEEVNQVMKWSEDEEEKNPKKVIDVEEGLQDNKIPKVE